MATSSFSVCWVSPMPAHPGVIVHPSSIVVFVSERFVGRLWFGGLEEVRMSGVWNNHRSVNDWGQCKHVVAELVQSVDSGWGQGAPYPTTMGPPTLNDSHMGYCYCCN